MEANKRPKNLIETEYFKSIEKTLVNMGIDRHQAPEKSRINGKNCIILALLALNIILSFKFLFSNEKTFEEFSECVYNTTTLMIDFEVISECIRNVPKINDLIMNFKNTIQKRKFKMCRFQIVGHNFSEIFNFKDDNSI